MNFRKSKRLNVASLNFLNMYFVKLSFRGQSSLNISSIRVSREAS